MALRDFDYKQFLMQHGERLGFGIGAGLAGLLVIPLLLSFWGYLTDGPGAHAAVLDAAAKQVDEGINRNRPDPGRDDLPGDPESKVTKDKLVAFHFTPISETDAKDYQLASLFEGRKGEQAQRALPIVLAPDEAVAEAARVDLRALVYQKNKEKLLALKGAPVSNEMSKQMGYIGNVFNPSGGKGSGSGKGYDPSKVFGQQPPGPSGPPGPPGIGSYPGGVKGSAFHDPKAVGGEKDVKDFELEWVELDKIKTLESMKLAEQPYPVRMVAIAASFPYKQELTEFKNKLNLRSLNDVFTQTSQEKDKEGKELPAFRFLGVNVQRRQFDAKGAPVVFDPQGDKDGWYAIDLKPGFTELLVLVGKRHQPEDPALAPVSIPGLIMPRLLTFGDKRTPPVDPYPNVEKDLKNIQTALAALTVKDPAEAKVAKPTWSSPEEGDIFSNAAATGDKSGVTGTYIPGGSMQSPGPGGRPPGGPPTLPPGFAPGLPPGVAPPVPPGVVGSPPGTVPNPAAGNDADGAIPDHCLVRLYDMTVEPGKTYQYRIQVRMGNPNYGRKDTAHDADKDKKELKNDESGWYTIPKPVTVPPELLYYAVDQKEIDAVAPKPSPKDPKDPKEPNKEPRPVPPSYSQSVDKERQTVLQIHHWLELLHNPKNRTDTPVGDWTIAERVVATRGEYVGRPQKVEVPYWRMTQDRYTLLSDAGPAKPSDPPKKQTTVEVPFAAEGAEPILVDFTNGDMTYKRTRPKTDDKPAAVDAPLPVSDKAPKEVLLFSDGKLILHDGTTDAADPDRAERLNTWRDWVETVRNDRKGGKDTGEIFGPPK